MICEILPNKAVSLPPKDLFNTSTYLVGDESKKIGDFEPHHGIIEPHNKQPQKYYNYTNFFVSDGPSTVTDNEPKVHTSSTLRDTSSTYPRVSDGPSTVTDNEPKVHTSSTLRDTSSTYPRSHISAPPAIANPRLQFTP